MVLHYNEKQWPADDSGHCQIQVYIWHSICFQWRTRRIPGFDSCDSHGRPLSKEIHILETTICTCKLAHVTLKFEGWPWKTTGVLSYAYISYVSCVVSISKIKLELSPGNTQIGRYRHFFGSCGLEIWQMTLKNKRSSHLPIEAMFHVLFPYLKSN